MSPSSRPEPGRRYSRHFIRISSRNNNTVEEIRVMPVKRIRRYMSRKGHETRSVLNAVLFAVTIAVVPAVIISLPLGLVQRDGENAKKQADAARVEKQSFVDRTDLIVGELRRISGYVSSDYVALVQPPENSDVIYDDAAYWRSTIRSGEFLRDTYASAAGESKLLPAPDADALRIKGLLENYCSARAAEIDDILRFSRSVVDLAWEDRADEIADRISALGEKGYSFQVSISAAQSLLENLKRYIVSNNLKTNTDYGAYAKEM